MPNPILTLQSSPHIQDRDSVSRIMQRVILSLVPACLAAVYFFRMKAVVLILVSLAASLSIEAIFLWGRKKPFSSLLDGSAVITGILLALTLPPSLPPGLAVIGACVSIGIGKQVFGGLGYNIFNPALVGRAFLSTAFPAAMTTWIPPLAAKVNTATFATPLGAVRFQDAVAQGTVASLKDLFWGNVGGCLGETSAFALLIGGLYLLLRKTIDWRIPLGIIVTLSCFTGAFWIVNPEKYPSPVFHLLAGGLVLGAFFMATDMVTSPITRAAVWIYAAGIGFFVGLIRFFSGFPEGVMYSILLMNSFVPLLEHYLRPRIFGEGRKA